MFSMAVGTIGEWLKLVPLFVKGDVYILIPSAKYPKIDKKIATNFAVFTHCNLGGWGHEIYNLFFPSPTNATGSKHEVGDL